MQCALKMQITLLGVLTVYTVSALADARGTFKVHFKSMHGAGCTCIVRCKCTVQRELLSLSALNGAPDGNYSMHIPQAPNRAFQ